jgi:hypothetical protein
MPAQDRQAVAENAAGRVRQHYTWEQQAAAVAKLVGELR